MPQPDVMIELIYALSLDLATAVRWRVRTLQIAAIPGQQNICLRRCLPKIRSAQGSKSFLQTNRKGRWACGPCLNLVNQIRCDVHLCASTLRTRKSERQYRQG